jgi:hypothetical protein
MGSLLGLMLQHRSEGYRRKASQTNPTRLRGNLLAKLEERCGMLVHRSLF